MEKVIIAAVAENGVIGRGGEIPWNLEGELKHFREKTIGNPVVMGRKTFKSLPEENTPLAQRQNIVLTRSDLEVKGTAKTVKSLDRAWKAAEKLSDTVYIIGGGEIYRQTIEKVDRMIITHVNSAHSGDTMFPEWDADNWEIVSKDCRENYSIIEYSSIQNR